MNLCSTYHSRETCNVVVTLVETEQGTVKTDLGPAMQKAWRPYMSINNKVWQVVVSSQNGDKARKQHQRLKWDGWQGTEVPDHAGCVTPRRPACRWSSLVRPANGAHHVVLPIDSGQTSAYHWQHNGDNQQQHLIAACQWSSLVTHSLCCSSRRVTSWKHVSIAADSSSSDFQIRRSWRGQ